MDWVALYAGLRTWVAGVMDLDESQVAWEGEPVDMRDLPFVDIGLDSHAASPTDDELRYTDQGPDQDLLVEAVGNRTMTLSIRAQTRVQDPATGRAFVLLERVRDRLQLPSAQAAFRALGVSVQDTVPIVNTGPVRDHREESVAVLDILLNYASSTGADVTEEVGTIEHAVVGGAGHAPGDDVTVVEKTIPTP